MAKYKVLKGYRDAELKRHIRAGEEVELTVKRAEEIERKLEEQGYEDAFLKRLDEPKKAKAQPKKELKEEVKEEVKEETKEE